MTHPDRELVAAAAELLETTAAKLERADRERATYRRRMSFVLTGCAVLIMALLTFVALVAKQNNEYGRQARDNAVRIAECTTPGTECFRSTQNAVQEQLVFKIQDALSHNQESIDFIVTCFDPRTLCGKQLAALIKEASK